MVSAPNAPLIIKPPRSGGDLPTCPPAHKQQPEPLMFYFFDIDY